MAQVRGGRVGRRLVAGAVALALLTVGLVGTSAATMRWVGTPRAVPVPTISWHACTGLPGIECAKVRVPLDHDNPTLGRITLSLDRVPAADPAHRIILPGSRARLRWCPQPFLARDRG